MCQSKIQQLILLHRDAQITAQFLQLCPAFLTDTGQSRKISQGLCLHSDYSSYFLITITALCPPKPKLLDMAARTSCFLAWLGT